jgi:hypothetical protein
MPGEEAFAARGREIVDSSLYMTIGTADADGRPWATPVYFAPDGYRELFWVSKPEARHSQNISVRPQVGIVIFDSRSPIGAGRGVYMEAVAEELTEPTELERGLEVFSRRSVEHGSEAWRPDDVVAPARLRLYRAVTSEQFVLEERDLRVPVTL